MPVVLRSVLLVGHVEKGVEEGDVEVVDRRPCDACGSELQSSTPVVRVRNRSGPAAIRRAWLCISCLGTVDHAIDLT